MRPREARPVHGQALPLRGLTAVQHLFALVPLGSLRGCFAELAHCEAFPASLLMAMACYSETETACAALRRALGQHKVPRQLLSGSWAEGACS